MSNQNLSKNRGAELMERFNKGATMELAYPFTELPPTSSCSKLASPRIGCNSYNLPTPTQPEDEAFTAELDEVLRVRTDIIAETWPSWFFEAHGIDSQPVEPILQAIYDAQRLTGKSFCEAACHLVHMDSPTDLGEILIGYLNANGYKPVDAPGYNDFLESVPQPLAHVANAVSAALEAAYQTKYFFGRTRPEEVAGFNCTAYPEGCPPHPAYPAGHGAAAGGTAEILCHIYGLQPGTEIFNLIVTACLQFAYFRTLAGMHYADDNYEGFFMGASVANAYALSEIYNFALAA